MTLPEIMRLAAVIISAAVLAACGGPGTPLGPPSAKDILAKPLHASLKDAHFIVTGKFTEQGVSVDLAGDGDLVYKAPGAGRFTFQTTVAGRKISYEDISINGKDYTFSPGHRQVDLTDDHVRPRPSKLQRCFRFQVRRRRKPGQGQGLARDGQG